MWTFWDYLRPWTCVTCRRFRLLNYLDRCRRCQAEYDAAEPPEWEAVTQTGDYLYLIPHPDPGAVRRFETPYGDMLLFEWHRNVPEGAEGHGDVVSSQVVFISNLEKLFSTSKKERWTRWAKKQGLC
jgi:hypothetical protein